MFNKQPHLTPEEAAHLERVNIYHQALNNYIEAYDMLDICTQKFTRAEKALAEAKKLVQGIVK